MGLPGWRRGVRQDRPKLSEGRLREGSRAPAPILLRAGEEGGRSPAALGELSQTSAPASGLLRAQVAVRKPEPGQPEHGGCQLESIPPGGMLLAAPSPTRGDHRLCSTDTRADPRATWHPAVLMPNAAAMAPFHAHEQSQGSTWLTGMQMLPPLQWDTVLLPFPPPTKNKAQKDTP